MLREKCQRILITHGTATLLKTARALLGVPDKTIVLTGSLDPARFRGTGTVFNIGFALAAAQLLTPGVYIAMQGKIYDPRTTAKNPMSNRFIDSGSLSPSYQATS